MKAQKQLAQGHTATKCPSVDLDVGRLAPEAEPLTTASYCFEFPVLSALDFCSVHWTTAFISDSKGWWLQKADSSRGPWLSGFFHGLP